MTEYRLGFTEKDIKKLFNIFDEDKNGTITYDEFLIAVRVSHIFPEIAHFQLGRNE
jgi:Ca2+-binding EF-hand superfamily protein